MKLSVVLMIVLSLFGVAPSDQLRAALLNPKAVEPLNTEELRALLAAQRGKVVLVNLWATWCAPCLKEIPALVKLQAQYREQGLKVIGISLDEPGDLDTVRRFAQKRFPEFTSYLRNDQCSQQTGTVIGVVVGAGEGYQPPTGPRKRDVTLPAERLNVLVNATALPVSRSIGAVPSPSQPRLMEPSGARKTPPCSITEP